MEETDGKDYKKVQELLKEDKLSVTELKRFKILMYEREAHSDDPNMKLIKLYKADIDFDDWSEKLESQYI